MRLIATIPVRNEDWCLALSARVALEWCDALVILDHASTDRTPEIITDLIAEYPGRVYRYREDSPSWDEMRHRQHMLEMARGAGATHIAIVDADEIISGNCINAARCAADECIAGYVAQLPGVNLRGGLGRYHANGLWANRWFSTAFKDAPTLHWAGDGYHHREPHGGKPRLHPFKPMAHGGGGVIHMWGASERRLRAKHQLYKITERLRFPRKPVEDIDKLYNLWRSPEDCRAYGDTEWHYASVPAEWWEPYAKWMQYLDVDAEPWQTAEVRRLVREYGREAFSGLDLFGGEE